MGLFDNPFRAAIGIGSLGLSELAGEDTMSKIPLLGSLGGYESDEKKALLAKQEELSKETAKRREQMQRAGMNSLGQRLLAFNPQNQLMAQMFGPEAAFTPEQFAQMVQSPMGPPQPDADLINYQGTDPAVLARLEAYMKERGQFDAEEQKRQQGVQNGMTPLGPGPAPIQQRRPAPARRF